VLALFVSAWAGCAGDDPAGRADQPPKLRLVYERIDAGLDEVDPATSEPSTTTREPDTPPQVTPESMSRFLDDVLADLQRFWPRAAPPGVDIPRVDHVWIAPGDDVETACRDARGQPFVADADAAVYCGADDTIYLGTRLAAEVWQGIKASGFPGQAAGYGRAVGDFGVAYMVAHEYGHNVQHDLTSRRPELERPGPPLHTRQLELHADCLAGLWANSVYMEGRVRPGDAEEAFSTVRAVGDFDVSSRDHHGTPDERHDAWKAGYANGDPADCDAYLEAEG